MKTTIRTIVGGVLGLSMILVVGDEADGTQECNGKTGSGKEYCGEARLCSDESYPFCNGTTVVREDPTHAGCTAGSSSEYCTVEPTVCTTTYKCKKDNITNICIPDLDNPELDSQGEPIVSTENRGVMKSCHNPS